MTSKRVIGVAIGFVIGVLVTKGLLLWNRESAELIPLETTNRSESQTRPVSAPSNDSGMPAWYRERLLAAKARHGDSIHRIPLWELVPGPCTCGANTNMMVESEKPSTDIKWTPVNIGPQRSYTHTNVWSATNTSVIYVLSTNPPAISDELGRRYLLVLYETWEPSTNAKPVFWPTTEGAK